MTKGCIPYPRRISTRTARKRAGFTLLEVIVSLALFGLVAMAAFAFLGQSLSLWERSGHWGEDERDIRLSDRTLERFASRLYAGPLPHGEEQGFIGDEHSVTALVQGEDGLIKAGIRYDGSSRSLVYWEEAAGNWRETRLVQDMDHCELAYLDTDQNWQAGWETQVPVPRCIRVRWSCRGRVQPTLMLPIYAGRRIPAPCGERMNERGSAILIVVWVILLVGAVALGVGYQLELDASLAQQFKDECQARRHAESILWWAVLQLQNDTDDVDTPEEFGFEPSKWQADLGSVPGQLLISDEGSRVNLNTAPEQVLKELFKRFKGEDALNPLLDWRDSDSLPRENGAEAEDYAGQSPPFAIRNGIIPVPQELQRVKNGKAAWEKLRGEITVWGPANLQMMDKEVLINLLREAGMEIDELSSVEIMQNFEQLRKNNQIQSLDDLSKVHPSINAELIDKLKPLISADGTYNPNFLTEDRMRAILAQWNIEPSADQKLLADVFADRSSFENTIHGMNPGLSTKEIWSVFTLESRIWRIEVSVKTSFRTLHLEAVVKRDREGSGQRWQVEILSFNESWDSGEEVGH